MEGRKRGVRAHVGAEIAVPDLGQRLGPAAYLPHLHPVEPARLPLLVESRAGYKNLCRLITSFKLREDMKAGGSALTGDFEEYGEGLVCLTGGSEGLLAAALAQGSYDVEKAVTRLVSIFGPRNVYVESTTALRPRGRASQPGSRSHRTILQPASARYGRGELCHGVRARSPRCLHLHSSPQNARHAGRLLTMNAERHLRFAREMQQLFYDLPDAISNTRELSSRLQFEMTGLGYEFPAYPVPDGQAMDSFLRKRVEEGIRRRYLPENDPALYAKAERQAERELRLIEQLGLAGFFLIVWDIVNFRKDNGILIQGRGSAANSVVCYSLENHYRRFGRPGPAL